jgi:hypothetical protein
MGRMKRAAATLWLVPLVLAAVFWFWPPRGDDSYHHSINAVEQVRAWREGASFPRYHRAWNGGTGTFVPTVYSPIPLSIQGALAWLIGDGQRAVGFSLAVALLVSGIALTRFSGTFSAIVVLVAPYILSLACSRSTTTEAWSMAGAAVVLPLALPPASLSTRRCLALALGVLLVAGCQVGVLLQLGWLLAVAWAVSLFIGAKESRDALVSRARRLARVLGWASAGLFAGAVLWFPAVVDAQNLAIRDLVTGSYDWRQNFLPATAGMGLFLTVAAGSLLVIAGLVAMHGEGAHRFVLAVTVVAGVVLSTPLSTPLWHLPKMEILQFPWRFLGPATLVAALAVARLNGRSRTAAMCVLLAPIALLPIHIGTDVDRVPTSSSPEELAEIGHRQWNLIRTLPTTGGLYAPGFHRLESLQQLERQRLRMDVVERDVRGGRWRVTTGSAMEVMLPLQWWPEWRITVDGVQRPFTNTWGLTAIELDAGSFDVRASLERSRSRAVGGLLSLVGLIALLVATSGAMRFSESAMPGGAE